MFYLLNERGLKRWIFYVALRRVLYPVNVDDVNERVEFSKLRFFGGGEESLGYSILFGILFYVVKYFWRYSCCRGEIFLNIYFARNSLEKFLTNLCFSLFLFQVSGENEWEILSFLTRFSVVDVSSGKNCYSCNIAINLEMRNLNSLCSTWDNSMLKVWQLNLWVFLNIIFK